MDTVTPPALAYSDENCTIGRAMGILGEKWTFLVVREVLLGIRRFEDMRVRTAIPKQVLTDRLALLVEHDILRKVPYQVPGSRARHEYRPTEKGLALYPILISLAEWGNRYLADDDGPPSEFAHRECGSRIEQQLVCGSGHAIDSPREVAMRVGPGAKLREVS